MSHSQDAIRADETIAQEPQQQQPLEHCVETPVLHHNQDLPEEVAPMAEVARNEVCQESEAVATVEPDAAVSLPVVDVAAEVASTEACQPGEGAPSAAAEEPTPAKEETPEHTVEASTDAVAEPATEAVLENPPTPVTEVDTASKTPVVTELAAVSPVLSTPANEISTTVTTQTGVAATADESDATAHVRCEGLEVLEEGGSQAAPPVEAVPKRAAERDSNDEADELTSKMPRTELSAAPCEPCDQQAATADSARVAEVDVQAPAQPAA